MRKLHALAPDRREALRGVDLSVPVGARLLLVGRPEESASLLLRVLAGLVRPADGRFSLAGVSRADDTPRGWAGRIAYVGPQPSIYPWLSPLEALSLAAQLAGLEGGEASAAVAKALDRFGLAERARSALSRAGPMVAQKTALAAGLLTNPEVLLLDEPLRSVNPDERSRLLKLKPRRLTVVIASRYPASEEGLVNQVAYLRDGRLVLHAKVSELHDRDLPLSTRGIEALADRDPAAGVAASRTGHGPSRTVASR